MTEIEQFIQRQRERNHQRPCRLPFQTQPALLISRRKQMADIFSKKKRSQVMAAIRSKGNKDTELKLASILRTNGIKGWRRSQRLPGSPDFVFRRERLAVFVDGCFWHACPKHGRTPDGNRSFWLRKLNRNKQRDQRVSRQLRRAGWRVLRFWAHDLSNSEAVVRRLASVLSDSGRLCGHTPIKHERAKRQNSTQT
jgi:DNA mismatch endonuclease, patch repair protein